MNKEENIKDIKTKNNNESLVSKWFLVLVSSKKIELIQKRILSMVELYKLQDIIIDFKIPSKTKLIQNENKDVQLKKINLHKGYLLMKIKVIHKNNKFIIPKEVKLILNTLNIKFLTLTSFNPRPLNEKEIENLIDIKENKNFDNKTDNNINININVNDKVKINFNNLNLIGVVKKIFNKNKILVEAIFFSKKTLIHVNKKHLTLVK
jgi:transcription antitermination factor NusG